MTRTRRSTPWYTRPGLGWLFAAAGLLLVALIAGPFIFFHFVEGSPPPPLTLPVGPGGTTGPVNGTWKLGGASQVGYRVAEILLGQHHTAVGRTDKVTGNMTIVGATVTSARFSVDMASVKSDQTGRDTVWRDQIMDTSSHPSASFTLTEPVDMTTVPGPGKTLSIDAVGTLSLRGVSRQVTFPLTAERSGSDIVVNGSLQIQFGLWHIPNPSFAVTQVGNVGTIEVLLYFIPSGKTS